LVSLNISTIGLGNMGTAISNIIAKKGFKVLGWEQSKHVVDEINTQHRNTKFLPEVKLHENLKATQDLEEALKDKDIIFAALPSAFIRDVLTPNKDTLKTSAVIVNLSKGIEEETCITSSQILRDIYKNNEVITLSGPSIANEFSRDFPCGVVLAGDNEISLCRVARIIETDVFRTRFSNDSIGVEWSGILKNIYAIGLGLIDGAGITSINFKAAYLTRAINEIADLVVAMGGKRETAFYLAGLGDLIATSLSEHSHNRRLGELLSKGFSFEDAKKEIGVLPEGVKTLKIAVYLSEKHHIPALLASGIFEVIDGNIEPLLLVKNFMKIGM
jgi:glycerol-3-phosphate dehydrogenase (NAD(P)+)